MSLSKAVVAKFAAKSVVYALTKNKMLYVHEYTCMHIYCPIYYMT